MTADTDVAEETVERARSARLTEAPAARLWPRDHGNVLAASLVLVGLALSIWMARASDGFYHDDDLTHLQMARWAWKYPGYLLDNWGRPGFTVLYTVPAGLGELAARIFSGVLTALTAWLAYRIAVRQQVLLAALVPALLWLEPLTFTLSYTTLTETALAFYLTLAMWLFLRGNFTLSAVVISLGAVTRHEGGLFLVLWAIALWGKKGRLHNCACLIWAPLAHNLLSWILLSAVPLRVFLDPKPTAAYGSGVWVSMLVLWVFAAGAWVLVLAFAGAPFLWKRPGGRFWIICGLSYFLAHTIIFRFGLFSSGGYARFLVSIGPVVAVAAAEGLSRFLHAARKAGAPSSTGEFASTLAKLAVLVVGGSVLLWATAEMVRPAWPSYGLWFVQQGTLCVLAILGVGFLCCIRRNVWAHRCGAVLPAVVLLWAAVQQIAIARAGPPEHNICRPLRQRQDQLLIRDAITWLESQDLHSRRIVTANPWADKFLNLPRPPWSPGMQARVARMQPGDLVLWDRRYSPTHNLSLDDLQGRPDLVELWHGDAHSRDGIYCYIFEKR